MKGAFFSSPGSRESRHIRHVSGALQWYFSSRVLRPLAPAFAVQVELRTSHRLKDNNGPGTMEVVSRRDLNPFSTHAS